MTTENLLSLKDDMVPLSKARPQRLPGYVTEDIPSIVGREKATPTHGKLCRDGKHVALPLSLQ